MKNVVSRCHVLRLYFGKDKRMNLTKESGSVSVLFLLRLRWWNKLIHLDLTVLACICYAEVNKSLVSRESVLKDIKEKVVLILTNLMSFQGTSCRPGRQPRRKI